jgi:hypothetical protein
LPEKYHAALAEQCVGYDGWFGRLRFRGILLGGGEEWREAQRTEEEERLGKHFDWFNFSIDWIKKDEVGKIGLQECHAAQKRLANVQSLR